MTSGGRGVTPFIDILPALENLPTNLIPFQFQINIFWNYEHYMQVAI